MFTAVLGSYSIKLSGCTASLLCNNISQSLIKDNLGIIKMWTPYEEIRKLRAYWVEGENRFKFHTLGIKLGYN